MMPTISIFFGISIRMYFDDHEPPHFHAYYGDDSAAIAISTLDLIAGRLPRRALALVLEWAVEHRTERQENWKRAEEHEPLEAIEPLT
jgi:hypothetical protein